MPVPVAGGVALTLRDKIVILGGYSDSTASAVDLIQIFDPIQKSWQIPGRLENPRYAFVADLYDDGVIVCGGGTGTNQALQPVSLELWSVSDSPKIFDSNETINRLYATGGVYGENLYLFGGSREPQELASGSGYILVYHIPDRTLLYPQDSLFLDQIPYQQMSVRIDGIFYLFGGVHFGVTRTVYAYDADLNRYQRIYPDLRGARAAGATVCTAPGQFLLLGGYDETSAALASTEIYEITDYGFQNRPNPSMRTERRELMAAFFGGSVYVFGGRNASGQIVASVEHLCWNDRGTTPIADRSGQPLDYRFDPAFPNPFNASTTLSFTLPHPSEVELEVYNLNGQKIATLLQGNLATGEHRCTWRATDQASGLYLIRLCTRDFQALNKVILVK